MELLQLLINLSSDRLLVWTLQWLPRCDKHLGMCHFVIHNQVLVHCSFTDSLDYCCTIVICNPEAPACNPAKPSGFNCSYSSLFRKKWPCTINVGIKFYNQSSLSCNVSWVFFEIQRLYFSMKSGHILWFPPFINTNCLLIFVYYQSLECTNFI